MYSVGKAAALVGMTAEALRHYDRIGLVKPSATDKWTKYRYYTEQDVIRLNVVSALRSMGISLQNIKTMLDTGDISKLIGEFERALRQADEKIRRLQQAKERIERVKNFYESKRGQEAGGMAVKRLPPRVILLSQRPISPTIEDLHDYHRHFYAQLGAERGALFAFEDLAGIYEAEGRQTMFALCTRHDGGGDLLTLPAGDYLYAECTDETYRAVLGRLRAHAAEKFGAAAAFAVRIVKLTGILQWKYEAQIWLGDADSRERGANAAPLPSIILS